MRLSLDRTRATGRDGRRIAAQQTALDLLAYCRANAWAGYDPYDALNSRVFEALPLLNCRLVRLALTQANRRSPFNLRPLLRVPKTQNPKGLALFLAALVKLVKGGLIEADDEIRWMADRLLTLRSEHGAYVCWGYEFPWQTRMALVPRGLPNIICTSFAANALLDVYETDPDPRHLDAAVSAARFILDVLRWEPSEHESCFSYTPAWPAQVHNANLLGAALLCRVARVSGETALRAPALAAVRYSTRRQHADGSWDYGETETQRWKDNFHTGYNLCALRNIGRDASTTEFEPHIRSGFEFYRRQFFRQDGAPRYYHDATYPIDIHSVAQSVITLVELRDLDAGNVELAHAVLGWAMMHLWNARRGCFHYQRRRHYTVRIPYMRWAQAWMLLALATIFEVE
jgi:hypothetical protein